MSACCVCVCVFACLACVQTPLTCESTYVTHRRAHWHAICPTFLTCAHCTILCHAAAPSGPGTLRGLCTCTALRHAAAGRTHVQSSAAAAACAPVAHADVAEPHSAGGLLHPGPERGSDVPRINIGVFGVMNAGKSTLMNVVTRQQTSIVDATPGTTTGAAPLMEYSTLCPVCGAINPEPCHSYFDPSLCHLFCIPPAVSVSIFHTSVLAPRHHSAFFEFSTPPTHTKMSRPRCWSFTPWDQQSCLTQPALMSLAPSGRRSGQ